MIKRVWECEVTDDGFEGLGAFLAASGWAGAVNRPGFRGGQVYRDYGQAKPRVFVVTHWLDEDSVAGHCGKNWINRPVAPEERRFMVGEPTVAHFEQLAVAP